MRHMLYAQILSALFFAGGLGSYFWIGRRFGLVVAGISILAFMGATIMSRMKSGEP